jgi:hypothetical protein
MNKKSHCPCTPPQRQNIYLSIKKEEAIDISGIHQFPWLPENGAY